MYTTDIHSKFKINIDPKLKDIRSLKPVTVPEMFHSTVSKFSNKVCMAWRVAETSDQSYHQLVQTATNSKWCTMNYSQVEQEVYRFGGACLAAGLEPKDSVIVMGFNSPQWLIAFHGTISAGGVVAGSYSTNQEEICLYLAKDSSARFIVVENWTHGKKFLKALKDPESKVSKIIVWNETTIETPMVNVMSFKDFMDSAPENSKELVSTEEQKLEPGECCDLIYTSGTTGPPKGVMLSHDNLTWDVAAVMNVIKKQMGKTLGCEQVILSYLPLSHIAAQMLDIMFTCYTGGSIWFATPDALKGGLLPLLQQTRPTFLFGVPRVWEKIMDAMKAKGANNSNFKKKIVNWAKYIALNVNLSLAESSGENGGWLQTVGLHWLFNKLVYSKVKEQLGLDRCDIFGSGAAPISENVLSFFWSLDIPIIEGFGMSETTGISTVCMFPKQVILGCVGGAICPNMIKLSASGEILLKGRHIMMGYLNRTEKTRATFDTHGYLKTGDVGTLVPSNGKTELLKITGRIKELIITAGGENVAPVPIEDQIKTECPIISNVMLIGDKKKFLSVLVSLRVEIDPDTNVASSNLDSNCLLALKNIGCNATTIEAARTDTKVLEAIQNSIDLYNNNAVSRAQKVQKFYLLKSDFTVAGGELTATQKLKRSVVLEKYKEEIESIYL